MDKNRTGSESHTNTSSSSKIRIPRPYGVKEAERHRHQPHMSSRYIKLESYGSPVAYQTPESNSLAAKVMDFAQESPVMRTLNGISGGVLEAAMTTVAAVTNIAETAAASLKESMPTSIDGN
jgi:hypothetical protein